MSYEDLFAVNAGEKYERDEKALAVQLEREYEARVAAKANAEKVNLVKENKVEGQKADENVEPIKRSRNVDEYVETSQGFEIAEEISPSGNDLGRQAGASSPEEQEEAVAEAKSTEEFNFEFNGNSVAKNFGESLLSMREYAESWEQYTNGDRKSGNISNNDDDISQLHE